MPQKHTTRVECRTARWFMQTLHMHGEPNKETLFVVAAIVVAAKGWLVAWTALWDFAVARSPRKFSGTQGNNIASRRGLSDLHRHAIFFDELRLQQEHDTRINCSRFRWAHICIADGRRHWRLMSDVGAKRRADDEFEFHPTSFVCELANCRRVAAIMSHLRFARITNRCRVCVD